MLAVEQRPPLAHKYDGMGLTRCNKEGEEWIVDRVGWRVEGARQFLPSQKTALLCWQTVQESIPAFL